MEKKKKEPKKRAKKYEKRLAVKDVTFEQVLAMTFGKKPVITPNPSK